VIGVSRTSLMVGGFRSNALLALLEEETVLHGGINSSTVNRLYRLMKICSTRSTRCDQYLCGYREKNDKRNPLYTLSTINNIFLYILLVLVIKNALRGDREKETLVFKLKDHFVSLNNKFYQNRVLNVK